jgi:hypothetical protein
MPLPAGSIYKLAVKPQWLTLLLVPPDRTGWIDPAGRLTDPDSHVPVGPVISYTPNECGDKALGGAGPVWPAPVVKHRGGS